MLIAIQGGKMATVECATKAHGRCKDVDCGCDCHPALRPEPGREPREWLDGYRAGQEDMAQSFADARRNRR